MRRLILALSLAVMAFGCSKKSPTSPPQTGTRNFQDNFDTQASMSNWHHTQDYRGGGAFTVVNGQFLRTTVGHVFYYNDSVKTGNGSYEFKAKGTWAFFWRGAFKDTNSGKVLEIQNRPLGDLQYLEVNWSGYDHGFHNGTATKTDAITIGQDLTNNLNQFKIVDNGTTALIYLNGELKLTETISQDYRNDGNIEIGANHWTDTTAFDDVIVRE